MISTIYYVGSLYERETAAGTTTHRHHIFAGGQAIGQMKRTQAGANSFEYFRKLPPLSDRYKRVLPRFHGHFREAP